MKRSYAHLIRGMIVLLLIALAGCGYAAGSGDTNGNAGTATNGSVSIQTDQSSYAPTASIKVTVTNHLAGSIYAYDTRASCSILDLQVQVNGAWQAAQAARCPLGRPARRVEIPSTHTYNATIEAGYAGISTASFPAGTYRLLLSYSTSATSLPQQSTTTVYSATFTVSSG